MKEACVKNHKVVLTGYVTSLPKRDEMANYEASAASRTSLCSLSSKKLFQLVSQSRLSAERV
jgi:hypothetical protein